MHNPRTVLLITLLPAALLLATGVAQAQSKGSGKIICWKDKSGKVVGCGDKVPPEYQDSATKELNQRGVTIRQSDAALTAEQRKAQQAEAERKQAEDQKREEQRRSDKAILDTFTNEKEIDLKRTRDVQPLESGIETLQTNLKNANDRQAEGRASIEQSKKNNKPVPPAVQDAFDRSAGDKAKIESQIAQRRKEIAALNQKYDEIKKRFAELKSGAAGAAGSSAKSAPQPAPAKK
jgi:predicted RNase H-like nuclease (RuvC/YqgF family)